MKIIAVAVGSYGDVEPFIVLGTAMKKRGHEFGVVAFSNFKKKAEDASLLFYTMPGNLEHMLKTMLADSDNSASTGIEAMKALFSDVDGIYQCLNEACQDADAVMYMQFGELAYHFAEKYQIPCIRSYVFPSDPTRQFSVMMNGVKDDSFLAYLSYLMGDFFMHSAVMDCVQQLRKKLELKKWHWYRSWKKQNGKPILTLYQYSGEFVPRCSHWGKHIHLTGPWYQDSAEFVPNEEIVSFLGKGKAPLYIGFGSMNYSKLGELGEIIRKALKKTGQRAIVSAKLNPDGKYDSDSQIYYVEYVPFQWLFPQIKAVVQHGGSGTVHYSLRNGKPTMVLSFGADQYFWGKRIAAAGCGPLPLDVKEDNITYEMLAEKFLELEKEEFCSNSKKMQKKMRKDAGTEAACDLIERYIEKERK